jgi:hypothetical protein
MKPANWQFPLKCRPPWVLLFMIERRKESFSFHMARDIRRQADDTKYAEYHHAPSRFCEKELRVIATKGAGITGN